MSLGECIGPVRFIKIGGGPPSYTRMPIGSANRTFTPESVFV